jgi:histidyl-tRNA synthetase
VATKGKFQAIKGTRDLWPPETELWNRVEATAREVFGTYGFGEIRPPIFEPTELFARAVGGETDIVSKEMYSFSDRHEKLELPAVIGQYGAFIEKVDSLFQSGEIPRSDRNELLLSRLKKHWKEFQDHPKDKPFTTAALEDLFGMVIATGSLELGPEISLRPEATASVCRAYIEHGMNQWPAPVKLYYVGPMFRRERPQKGRYRQFYQIGAEVLGGTDAPGIDAEVIEMVMTFFGRLDLPGVHLDINSIGHNAPECRRGYVKKLRAALLEVKDQLGEDSRRRIETNPLRVLDSKLEHEQAIIATLPKIGDCLCDDCAKHYAEVKRQLDLRGIPYKENWRLVRGLDYYMRTTFEITAKGLGSQNAVCGGGRYDGLVELLGGPATKGIGFAIGEDRLILSLQEAGKGAAAPGRDVYIAWMGQEAQSTASGAAQSLRRAGFSVEVPAVEQKFGKSLSQADRLGAKYALILGADEVSTGQWTVKLLADSSQEKIAKDKLVEYLRSKKGGEDK